MPNATIRHLTPVVDSILDLVGHTPMLHLKRFCPERNIFAKLEYLNPGGSVKDRIGVGMILAAEKAGLIKPGISTIIEPTAGNTGVGLAIAAVLGGHAQDAFVSHGFRRDGQAHASVAGGGLDDG